MFGSKGKIHRDLVHVQGIITRAGMFLHRSRKPGAKEMNEKLWQTQLRINKVVELEERIRKMIDEEL